MKYNIYLSLNRVHIKISIRNLWIFLLQKNQKYYVTPLLGNRQIIVQKMKYLNSRDRENDYIAAYYINRVYGQKRMHIKYVNFTSTKNFMSYMKMTLFTITRYIYRFFNIFYYYLFVGSIIF